MSPEEMDEELAEHGDECAEHGPWCEDEDCLTVEQVFHSDAIESDVEMGILTETEAANAHYSNGTYEAPPADPYPFRENA